MTNEEKEKIPFLRHKGHSYSKIAIELGISENTVKSFCQRNNLGTMQSIKNKHTDVCKECGISLIQGSKGQPKKFCSGQCRRKWWVANDTALARKAYYILTCAKCGIEFESYGNKNRKYCSHACYINSRFKEGGNSDVS